MTTTDRTAEHGTFTLSRTYPVPPERVFAAWASQEAKARWFGAPGTTGYALGLPRGRDRDQSWRPPRRARLHL